jgi:hypothetical protein
MRREEMADLTAFVVVVEERSFTKAAAKLGLSQSSLSCKRACDTPRKCQMKIPQFLVTV